MRPQTSTDYNVDQRYSETTGASDNNAGKQFLNKFINEDKQVNRPEITQQRKQDNRFVLGGMGGTIPVGSLGLGQQVRTTDMAYSFKNAFGSSVAPAQKRLNRLG
jgi:hypothetical protein